jgi:hypothetical protein
MFVAGVVVCNAVNIQLGRHSLVDGAQERQKLLMAVPGAAMCQHLTIHQIQRREQCCGAVTHVVMRLGERKARLQRLLAGVPGVRQRPVSSGRALCAGGRASRTRRFGRKAAQQHLCAWRSVADWLKIERKGWQDGRTWRD